MLLLVLLVVSVGSCRESGHGASADEREADDDAKRRKRKPKKVAVASCAPCETGRCSAEDAAACHALAIEHGRGRGVPFDLAKKARYEKLACDHDHGPGCTELAWLHHDGAGGLPHADATAAELYEKACRLDDGDGCVALGTMHEQGIVGVANLTEAKTWFERGRDLRARGCDAGQHAHCAKLGRMYLEGVGATQNDKKAYAAFEKGCPSGALRSDESCVWQALSFISGRGVAAADMAKGAKLLGDACERGVSFACGMLGQELWLGRHLTADALRAKTLLEKACDDNDGIACGALGAMLEGSPGVPRDVLASLERRERACQLRNSLACREAANLLMSANDETAAARARVFFEHGCYIGDGAQCGLLAILYRHGRGGAPDEVRGNALFGMGCQRRSLLACVDLIRRNEALPLNEADAKLARAEACKSGLTAACVQTL